MRDVVTVPLTPAQSTRLHRLVAQAAAAAQQRDEVLSALVEGVTDQSMQAWTIQIQEREIVLTAPMIAPSENGGTWDPDGSLPPKSSQADAMSP